MNHFIDDRAAQNSVPQGLDDLTALNDRAHELTLLRAAIGLNHNQVLRHIDQTTCEVTRVRCFERRVGQTFTRTVRRDEVLKHVQAFTEVGRDGCLNDGAIGLGHQTTHTRQLANLSGRSTRAGVGHHVDRIEGLLLDLVAVAINGLFFSELIHHHFGDGVSRLAPNVHDLVVALPCRHQTGDVLLLDLFDLFFCILNQAVLFLRHEHVIDTNRNARTGGQTETILKQAIGKHHGLFETAFAERGVDQARNFFLLQRFVQVAERQALGQNFRQQGATHGGLHHGRVRGELTRHFVLGPLGQTHIDL